MKTVTRITIYVFGSVLGGFSLGFLIGISRSDLLLDAFPLLLITLITATTGYGLIKFFEKNKALSENEASQKFALSAFLIFMITIGTVSGHYVKSNMLLINTGIIVEKFNALDSIKNPAYSRSISDYLKSYDGVNGISYDTEESKICDKLNHISNLNSHEMKVGWGKVISEDEELLTYYNYFLRENSRYPFEADIKAQLEYLEEFKKYVGCL